MSAASRRATSWWREKKLRLRLFPEHAPIAIKASGISCVIASTFARIFYRNAINIGLAILECDEAARDIRSGDEVKVDFDTGRIENLTTGRTYQAEPFPPLSRTLFKRAACSILFRTGCKSG